MVKKVLSLVAFLSVGSLMAQNLVLNDANDNSIDSRTHYIYDSGLNLAETKLHVANSSGADIDFDVTVYEKANPLATDWQVCFGTLCFSPSAGISAGQSYSSAISPSSGTYNDLKVAPFSFGWMTGDYGVWRVKVFDSMNPSDSSSSYVVWTSGGSFSGDQNGNNVVDGNEIAGDIDGNGAIDGSEITGDMNGNGIIDEWEVNGDANGNGIIDNGEIVSVQELTKDDVVMNTYPNPASNSLIINYSIDGDVSRAQIDVYDLLGQKINTYSINKNKGQLNLNVENMDSGVYFYTINVEGERIRTKRVIVQ